MTTLDSIFDSETPTADIYLSRMRAHRDRLLKESDWTQTADDPTGKREAWATYRQQLRDFPATWVAGSVADFPDPPEVI